MPGAKIITSFALLEESDLLTEGRTDALSRTLKWREDSILTVSSVHQALAGLVKAVSDVQSLVRRFCQFQLSSTTS